MKAMKHFLRNILRVLSILTLFAVGLLWARSYWYYDTLWTWQERIPSFRLSSHNGKIWTTYYWSKFSYNPNLQGERVWLADTMRLPFNIGIYNGVAKTFLGFGVDAAGEQRHVRGQRYSLGYREIQVPYWFLAALASLIPSRKLWRYYRGRTAKTGVCLTCGYDLRASPDRCPECGAETPGINSIALRTSMMQEIKPVTKYQFPRRTILFGVVVTVCLILTAIYYRKNRQSFVPPTAVPVPKIEVKAIPKLNAIDVYRDLVGHGFTLTSLHGHTRREWACSSVTEDWKLEVKAVGPSPIQIVLVEAKAQSHNTNGPDKTGTEFLSKIAMLPYQGAEPEKAKRWVEQNFGQNTSTLISGVRYSLSAEGTSRVLTIALP